MSNSNSFKINDFITLKLEYGITNIYIKGKRFQQCKYLLLDVPLEKELKVDGIDSIDEASETLDHSMELNKAIDDIPPELEFWGHCSNLQTWVENDYDTRILHRNLAFPLLKRLTDVGDHKAKRVFKEEIAKRLERKYIPVIQYLIHEKYLDYLSEEEFNSLDKGTIEIVQTVSREKEYYSPQRPVIRNFHTNQRRSPEPEDIEGWLEVVEEFITHFQYHNALIRLKLLHAREPTHQTVLLKLGDLFYRQGQESEALKYYLKLLYLDSENINVLSRIGILLFKYGLKRSTFKICLKILKIDPQYFRIFGLIRDLALRRYRKAFDYMKSAENADISVGSVGSGANKNTVFARSGIGTEIMEDAAEKGYLKIEPFNAINLNAVLFLAKLKKVSQYNIQKRKVFIVRDLAEKEEARIETKPEAEQISVSPPLGTRKFISASKTLNEETQILTLSLTNTIGYVLEGLKIRVVTVEELFEKRPWITNIKELFPFETIEIGYPLEIKEGEPIIANILVEASTETFGKIFSRTFKIAPEG